MLNTIKVYGLLGLYGAVIGFGSFFFYYFLPETEGCTLHEIESHFAQRGNVFKRKIDRDNYETPVSNTSRMKEDIESYL